MIQEAIIFAVIACAGVLVVSFVGFGLALVMVPLLSLFLLPREFLPSYHMLALICQLILAIESRKHIRWRPLARLGGAAMVGIPLGTIALKHLPTDIVSLTIAVLTLVFATIFLVNARIRARKNAFVESLVGLASGFLSGCTAQSGPPIIIYGLARQWDKDMFRATLLAYFSGLSMMTLIWYFSMGLVTVKATTTAGVALLPALAVAYLGVRLKNRVNEMVFRRVVLLVIMAVGCMGLASYFLNTSG